MKKHVVWLLLLALILTTAVAVAANESGNEGAVHSTVGNLNALSGSQGGGCTIGTWTAIASLNTARSRTGVAYSAATDQFYVLGGEATGGNRDIPIEEYDSGTNTWSNQTNLTPGVSNSGAVGVGNYIYLPGGFDGVAGQTAMQRYDPVADSISLVAALPAGNYAHAVTALGTDIYVVGGSATGAAGTTNYIYDSVADSWSTGAPLLTAVQYPTAVSDGTYVYVLGGNTTNLTTVQQYDPVADSWSNITAMGTGRGGPGAFFDGQNIWAIAGGWATYLTSTEYWDGVSWTAGPAVNVGARTIGAAFANGIGLKAGGWNGGYVAAAETITIDCGEPEVVIDKSPDSQVVITNGNATFTITVTNTGTVQLDDVTVTDALVPACDSNLGTLAAGASTNYTCTDVGVTASYTNTAVVSGTFDVGLPPVTASDDAFVEVQPPTAVSLTNFGGETAALSPLWIAIVIGIIMGFGIFLRRRLAN